MSTSSAVRNPRDVQSSVEAQKLASRRLGFTVTRACPLSCAHCSVEASPHLKSSTMDEAFGLRVAQQIPGLAQDGVTCIDFTGGEPTLAAPFVLAVGRAAADAGMSCGIVTAAHWATTPAAARRLVQRFDCIQHWDISTDIYHLPFVSLDKVELAFAVLTELGRRPLIRVAHHEPMTYPEAVLIDRVYRFAGKRIAFQPIGPVGRAVQLVPNERVGRARFDFGPCPTTGLLIQPAGVAAPCCAPASHESHDHPLVVGNAMTEPLHVLLRKWRTQPLLQTIRLWGFGPLLEWFDEAGLSSRNILRERACDTCVQFLRDPRLAACASSRAAEIGHQVKVAFALLQNFDEPWMAQALQLKAQQMLAECAP